MDPLQFRQAVLTYCARFEASETSGRRTTKHNKLVGGVEHSAHLYGLASDVVYDDLPPEAARLEGGRRLGLRVIPEGSHDHLQPLDWTKG